MRFIVSVVLAASMVLVAGCAGNPRFKTGDTEVNEALFDGKPQVFDEKVGLLKAANLGALAQKRSLSEGEVFELLRVRPSDKFSNVLIMDRNTARTYVFGPTNLTSLHEVDEMRARMDRTTVKTLPFMSIETYASFKRPFHVNYNELGWNLRLILVFNNGGLHSAFIEGTGDHNTKRSQILLNPFSVLESGLRKLVQ